MSAPIYKMRTVTRRFTMPSHNPNLVTQHEELECGHVIRARSGRISLEDIIDEKKTRRQCFECGRLGVK